MYCFSFFQSRSHFDEITGKFEVLRKGSEQKLQTLKQQYQAHKTRWMSERELLVRAVQSSEAHREVAQGFAEKAVSQMESMIEAAESQVRCKSWILWKNIYFL